MVSTSPPLCSCSRGFMKLLQSKTDDNPDQWFYRCPFPDKHQGYLKWWDEYHGLPWPGASQNVDDEPVNLNNSKPGVSDTFEGSCSTPNVSNLTKTQHQQGVQSGERLQHSSGEVVNHVGNKHLFYVDIAVAFTISVFVMLSTIACLYLGIQIGRNM